MKCDARLDSKGALTLIFGAPTIKASVSAGSDLQAAHHVSWNVGKGVTRVWDGFLEDEKPQAIQSGKTHLGHPKRLSFVVKPEATQGKVSLLFFFFF